MVELMWDNLVLSPVMKTDLQLGYLLLLVRVVGGLDGQLAVGADASGLG